MPSWNESFDEGREKMPEVKQAVKRCGMRDGNGRKLRYERGENLHRYEEIPDEAGYYSLLIIKEKKG